MTEDRAMLHHSASVYKHVAERGWSDNYLDGHGFCGAVQPGPQGFLHCINALISVACHLDVCRWEREKDEEELWLWVTSSPTENKNMLPFQSILLPALILTACGVSRLLMLSISTLLSSSVKSRPSRMAGSLGGRNIFTIWFDQMEHHLRAHILCLKTFNKHAQTLKVATYDTACLKTS